MKLHHLIPLALFIASSAFATPYWTPEQIAADEADMRRAQARQQTLPPPASRPASPTTLDEGEYFEEFVELCDFLTGLQYTLDDPDLGGMREGETGVDFHIIQTDNTQEAIRDWSQYGLWTGDTARYADNIRNALIYCELHPAWQEEGGAGGYYQIHNCGWGIEAIMMYRQAYDDTSWDWYADACTERIVTHNLGGGTLDRFAMGLGVGGGYQWAQIREREDWTNTILQDAADLRDWLEGDPDSRIRGGVWALCGGTSVWGLCRSIFTHDPVAGVAWITEYGPELAAVNQTEATNWFNSFRTWNCNATYACYELTQIPLFYERTVAFADTFIALDTDEDGGIMPGTCCDATNDHSWVSAYYGWMALANLANAASYLTSPDPSIPHRAGVELPVSARIFNRYGETAAAGIELSTFNYGVQTAVELEPFAEMELELSPWTLPDNETLPDNVEMLMVVTLTLENTTVIDSIRTQYDIRRGVFVNGTIRGEYDETMVPPSRIEFRNLDLPDSVVIPEEIQTGDSYTSGTTPLMEGVTEIRVIPPARYMQFDTVVNLNPISIPNIINIWLESSELVLVDDDNGGFVANRGGYETYVSASLDELGYRTRIWDQLDTSLDDVSHVETIVWITGGEVGDLIPPTEIDAQEQQTIEDFLDGGGKLLLSGQDIIDDLRGEAFLEEVLHCQADRDTINPVYISGDGEHPVFGDVFTRVQTGSGAPNQYSPASMLPLDDAESILILSSSNPEDPPFTGGITTTHNDGRLVFLSFGLEGLPDVSLALTRRAEFMELCFDWLDNATSAAEPLITLPRKLTLSQNYPNPFNPSTAIRFTVPQAQPVTLVLYDILGREVARLFDGTARGVHTVHWNGENSLGQPVASGTYICTLRTESKSLSHRLQLLR